MSSSTNDDGAQNNTNPNNTHSPAGRSCNSHTMAILTPIKGQPTEQLQQQHNQQQQPKQQLTQHVPVQREDIATQTDQQSADEEAATTPALLAEAVKQAQHQPKQHQPPPQATTINSTTPQPPPTPQVETSNNNKRDPNVMVDDQQQQQQHNQQQMVPPPTPQQNNGQTERKVKSAKDLRPDEALQLELTDALVVKAEQRQQQNNNGNNNNDDDGTGNGHGGGLRRSISVIGDNWLSYDWVESDQTVDQIDIQQEQPIIDDPNNNVNADEEGLIDQISSAVASLSTINLGPVYTAVGNGWDFFADLWQYRLFRFAFILLCIYFGMGFMERLAVAMIAACVRWAWPPVHFMHGSSRGTLFYLTDWFAWMDDFLSSWVCDMANRYCHQYGVMCDSQCSFVGRTQRAAFFTGRRF
ncbi:hypothetical protein niasHT_001421 [Heterodera trifolii]|uniref:Uncharacterized protein n=1 Tax=Heterodera trifolii TaxID=157864 RepID=A0ABD2LRG3_9BILA